MLRMIIFVVIVIIIVVGAMSIFLLRDKDNLSHENIQNIQGLMKLTSNAFAHNEIIPSKYTCDGENINPALLIEGVPEGTKELMFIVDDPDAPTGTWIHWTMWNIPPDTKEIMEDSIPSGAKEGLTSFGSIGYGGPCPPAGTGTHRYSFRAYALDKILSLSEGASLDELENEISTSVIDRAEIIGLYTHEE